MNPSLRALVTAGLSVALGFAALGASTFLPADFRAVAMGADLIVLAQVTDVRVARSADGDIETVATLRVEDTLKGHADTFVSMRVPGGVLGRYRTVVPGAPTVRTGEAGVYFLKRHQSGWWPVSLASGIYRVQRTGDRLTVSPPVLAGTTATADAPVVRGDARRAPMNLATFQSIVTATLAFAQERR